MGKDEFLIPVGFSGPLQPDCDASGNIGMVSVSIPVGFSGPLQPRQIMFSRIASKVSIPVGFSGPLQPR
jgi:hypothetical protein